MKGPQETADLPVPGIFRPWAATPPVSYGMRAAPPHFSDPLPK
jgi:hypothetical protein